MRTRCLVSLTLLAGILVVPAADRLERNFASPPAAARPWVYWVPLDGNISSNGITLDLEAMARVGIGGVLYMETEQGTPRGPAAFGGELWRNLFKHACAEAKRLGLQINMNNDAGWCGSGGPWITPALSMQKIVWTETNLTGPLKFDAPLAGPKQVANYYADIAVFAFPAPENEFRIPKINGKSALTREEIPLRADHPAAPAGSTVNREQILNLTSHLDAAGRLTWEVPAGKWRVVRMGHTSTGKDNHPAPIAGRGLESDKLSKAATDAHWEGLMAKLIADNRPLVGQQRTFVSTHIDSWETGSQNWTPKWREEFQRLRGYDPLPLLPVITGQVVDSLEVSERYLYDVRMTVNDLLLENYARHFRELARRHGMRLSIEAYDGVPADDLTFGGCADEPMAEFWSWAKFGAAYSCTEMASSAHVYGRPILGAEAFTATDAEKWQGHPAVIKELGDWAFCEGINRFVFHRYALQPWPANVAPGVSMGPWGLHYERTQTWWEQSKAWHEYLARCQFLLQQGTFVADLCFLAPENSPQRWKSPVKSGFDRPGYNFDGCPPEVLLTRMKLKDGRLTLPEGGSYQMLVLPKVETMSPQLLRRLKELVTAGATIVGAPPRKSPSLTDYPKCDLEVQRLVAELWGGELVVRTSAGGASPLRERRLGKGRVLWGGEFSPPAAHAENEPNPLQTAKWIWHRGEGRPAEAVPAGKRYFRCPFTVELPGDIVSAQLTMTADNSFECWLNGKRLGSGDNFKHAYVFDARPNLQAGGNLLAVAAVNATDNPSPAGLIAALVLKSRDGKAKTIVTDSGWSSTVKPPEGWDWRTSLDSAGWTLATTAGPLGIEPWGELDDRSDAADPTPDIHALSELLHSQGVPPDFSFEAPKADALRFIHKHLSDVEVYFVANKYPEPLTAKCAFRIVGRRPELWWPDSGRTERPALYDQGEGLTQLPVHFEPSGSVFVIFRRGERTESDRVVQVTPPVDQLQLTRGPRGLEFECATPGTYALTLANGAKRSVVVPAAASPISLTGVWEVAFDPNWGGPAQPVVFAALEDWSKRPEAAIRFYSGTAVYRKQFTLPADAGGLLADASDRNRAVGTKQPCYLDLGKVAVMAQVILNGKDLGVLWKPPYRLEVSEALRLGENTLELRVVNLWINRQIGDMQLAEDSERNANGTLKSWPQWLLEGKPSPTGRQSFTSWRLWQQDSPLAESGLLGPVTLQTCPRVPVTK